MHRSSLAGLATVVAFLATGALRAQLSVELVRVPDRVSGSLEGGRNLVVTAAVRGADVVEVWLAVDVDASERAPLTRSGPDRWQVNLASGRAADLLGRYGKGAVAVHARTSDGETASSVPIRFDVPETTARSSLESVRIVATVDGERRLCSALDGEELWFAPDDVSRLEVRLRRGRRADEIEVEADDRSWRFAPDEDDERTAELRISGEIADAWRRNEVLVLRASDECTVRLRAIPRELEPGERHRFSVHQREERELPGSSGKLELSLGDVTAGQVRVEIRTDGDWREVASRSMHEGDRLRFEHDGRRYVLELDRLVNYLIGNDYARFVVWRPEDGERASTAR